MVKGNLWRLAEFLKEMLRVYGVSGGRFRAATRLGLGAAVARGGASIEFWTILRVGRYGERVVRERDGGPSG
ncbi:MAG: hypothetical protein HOC74_07805 [Gemmatimonadetes bacterium]|jgi:hypothetical protein|nr:hypothetical protein [Gemmatimonadota bacterium]